MRRIVLMVDQAKDTNKLINIARNDIEGNTSEQTRRLEESLGHIAEVIRYTSPSQLEYHIAEHSNDIVFPMYYGTASPNSKGIVPALCEAANIPYVGADVYAQIICNDKTLSKQYAKAFGIQSPKGHLMRSAKSIEELVALMRDLHTPLVVKPNFGGGSAGISSNNIVDSYDKAAALARELYGYFHIPILIEEYIEGYEVELIVVGTNKRISFCEEVQLLIKDKAYFNKEIWGFESKDIDDSIIDFQISNCISPQDRNNLFNLFKSFEKLEMIRFDGRVKNGTFYLLELSPDCYLGDDCAFYYAFEHHGYSHTQMLQQLINNALNLY